MAGLACDLCMGRSFDPLLEKNGARYLECRGCGLVRSELTDEELERANAEIFGDALAHFAAKSYTAKKQGRYAARLRRLEPHRGGGRLLEVGANVGGFIDAARRRGWEAVGVEPVAACARYAREERGLDVRCGTLESLALPEESFDLVYANAVFEHLARPRRELLAAARLLRPGGVIFIDTVNIDAYTYRFIGAEWKLVDPWMHAVLYAPRTLRALCEACDLEVLSLRSHRVRFRPESSPRLRGLARLAEELRKLPWSVACRLWLRGESLAVLARKR